MAYSHSDLAEMIAKAVSSLAVIPHPATSPPVQAGAKQLAAMIDHTLLRPTATESQFRQLCSEAAEYGFATVCVNPVWVEFCASLLSGSSSAVCSVVGFPLGATTTAAKVYETGQCTAAGAAEVDMVINIGALQSGDHVSVYSDIAAVVEAAKDASALLKVIIETCYLSESEKIAACVLAEAAGADFVKTSTGFGPGGASTEDVALMRRVVGPQIGVKAAGGIRTLADADAMIAAGASRIGSSSGVSIMREAYAKNTQSSGKH